jgi:hypothetical protein
MALGLTPIQHAQVGRMINADAFTTAPKPDSGSGPQFPGTCRLITLEAAAPAYTPKTLRSVGLFRLNSDGQQKTIEFTGHALEGDLILAIGGTEIQINCKATTAELREKLRTAGINSADCRANVFPGLWEFDFNGGRWAQAAPAVTCEAFEPPPEDTETPVFSGQLTITSEAWVSLPDNAGGVTRILCRDWIPHKPGAIKAGAIGAAVWCHEAGWLVLAWQCRDYSFRAGY